MPITRCSKCENSFSRSAFLQPSYTRSQKTWWSMCMPAAKNARDGSSAINSVQDPELDRIFDGPQLCNNLFVVFFVDIRDHIADRFGRFQILADDVDTMIGQHLVDLSQDARNVVVNMNEAVSVF